MPNFTILSDAEIVAPKTFTILSDAEIVAPKTFTILSDAEIVVSPTIRIQSDAVIGAAQLTITSDAEISAPTTFTILSDALIVFPEPLPTGIPNPQRPCPAVLKDCECQEDPISNYSSEDPDPALFCAVATYTQTNPTLGQCGGQGSGDLSATEFCCSDISQEDAYLCALRKAQEKVLGGSP